jgi:hypothetical protein
MKKVYRTPRLIRIDLKLEQTVLGVCKIDGYTHLGPSVSLSCKNLGEYCQIVSS